MKLLLLLSILFVVGAMARTWRDSWKYPRISYKNRLKPKGRSGYPYPNYVDKDNNIPWSLEYDDSASSGVSNQIIYENARQITCFRKSKRTGKTITRVCKCNQPFIPSCEDWGCDCLSPVIGNNVQYASSTNAQYTPIIGSSHFPSRPAAPARLADQSSLHDWDRYEHHLSN